MVRVLFILSTFLSFLFSPASVLSEPKASLSVAPSEGSRNDQFTLTLDVWGISDPSSVTPYLIGGDSFTVNLTGKHLGVVNENGKTAASISFSYSLFPKDAGSLQTPGAEVHVDGEVIKVESQRVIVKPGPIDVPTEKGDLFLRQRVDIPNPYIGQQIVLTVDIYTAINLIQPRIDITAPGFLQEELGKESKHERVVNGVRYEVISLRRSLFPQKEGTITIPSQTLTAMIRERGRGRIPFPGGIDPFDFMMGFDNVVSKTIRSAPLDVEVRSLPSAAKDALIVGETIVTSIVTNDSINLGDSTTLTVTIESAGDLSLISAIPLEFPSWIKVYADSPEKAQRIRNGRLFSSRTFKVSLVPTRGGTANLPAIVIPYFDPESGEVKEAKGDPIVIKVEGAKESDSSRNAELGLPKVQETEGEVREDSPRVLLREISTGAGLLALAISLLIFTVVLFWHRIFSRRRAKDPFESFLKAKSAKELYQELCKILAPDGGPVRDAIKTKTDDKSIRYSAETLLDDLERAIFGAKDEIKIEELKERAKAVAIKVSEPG